MATELNRNYNLIQATNTFQRHGFSRTDKLRILKVGPFDINERVQRGLHYATTASLPPLTREPIQVPYQGTSIQQVGQLNWGTESSITFRTPADFLVYNTLQQWITEAGVNPLTGEGGYCIGDDSTIQYVVLDELGRISRGVEFYGVFPQNVGEISYDATTNDTTTFDFSFGYTYHCPIDLSTLNLEDLNDVVSDSASTNKSLVFDQYEAIINQKETSTDTEC